MLSEIAQHIHTNDMLADTQTMSGRSYRDYKGADPGELTD